MAGKLNWYVYIMNWTRFQTYGDSQQTAFETFCNQIFEKNLRRRFGKDLLDFKIINAAGGDGGIESYGLLGSGEIIAIQSKWFRTALKDTQIAQIKDSISTALKLRPNIIEYIISIPHNIGSLKFGRGKKGEGKKPIERYEETTIREFEEEIRIEYPLVNFVWWFESTLDEEILQVENEGIHKFWFEKEVISLTYLRRKFQLNKSGWLSLRYVPELNGRGVIHSEYNKLCFGKEYREKLILEIESVINEINISNLYCYRFIESNSRDLDLNEQLSVLADNLKIFANEYEKLKASINSSHLNYAIRPIDEISPWQVIQRLESYKPTNIQKEILPRLIRLLNSIFRRDLSQYLLDFQKELRQIVKLILGDPGTGKTHGLAFCAEHHLDKEQPAVIIRAKGTPCNDWTSILSSALELKGWQKEDIFSALETLAIRSDRRNEVGSENASSIVLICIDGLEEDILNQEQWLDRVREIGSITHYFPRLRFLLSARKYFADNSQLSLNQDIVTLPREGNVDIDLIAEKYFSEENYNIKFESNFRPIGLDSLLSLRLFCDEYRGRTLHKSDQLTTASRDLINLKINRIESEFRSIVSGRNGKSRTPVRDSLWIAAQHFYTDSEIDHVHLSNIVSPDLSSYLDVKEIDLLIEHLVNHGILVAYEIFDDQIIQTRSVVYSVAFQSVLEHVISELVYERVKSGSLDHIPQILQQTRYNFNLEASPIYREIPINERIIQDIANRLLQETGKLIGEENMLNSGFSKTQITKYQLTAISSLDSPEAAARFKQKIDNWFFSNTIKRKYVFDYLIVPSSYKSGTPFGAIYLHDTLMSITSVFERDKLWSGYDSFEKSNLSRNVKNSREWYGGDLITDETIYISDTDLHDQKPLILAWGLSYLQRSTRDKIRIALADWAIKNPGEYLILLDMIFDCGDPQIQEDLASVTLGYTSRTKDLETLKKVAVWVIEKIFEKTESNRNVKVRLGFRAVAERAFQFGLISLKEVSVCRPRPIGQFALLPLDLDLELHGRLECYPIVHDLAWYVISRSFSDFLEYPIGGASEADSKDNDCPEGKMLLDHYRSKYNEPNISCSNWAMYAAIPYIRSLGFTREDGNHTTEARHGGKSARYTYEEKYTWLAVNYIQGYLSDYVPLKMWNNSRAFIEDYSQITDLANPAEDIIALDERIVKFHNSINWVVKENLSKEIEHKSTLKLAIHDWVHEEPDVNFANWIEYTGSDFNLEEGQRKYTAIYNETTLYESMKVCHTTLDIRACLVEIGSLEGLRNLVLRNPERLHFTGLFANYHAAPRVDVYSNPSDVVWMQWIPEESSTDHFFDRSQGCEKSLHRSITRVVRETPAGERSMMIPSKIFRELLDISDMVGNSLHDKNGGVRAFIHNATTNTYGESQEIVLVDAAAINNALEIHGHQMAWFVELFKEQNPLDEKIKGPIHEMKSRKYLVWDESGIKKSVKFWDERFLNARD